VNIVRNEDIPDLSALTPQQESNIKEAIQEGNEQEVMDVLEIEHAKSIHQTDQTIIEAFPVEQALVVKLLDEYWAESQILYQNVIKLRNMVDKTQEAPFTKWFFTNAQMYEDTRSLQWFYQQIKRLQRLKVAYEKNEIEKLMKFVDFDTKEERKKYNIDKMFAQENLLVDIASFDGIRLRGAGSRFMGKCPFHSEKTGSFAIYSDNWFHCFGCQAHGNFINYLMKTRNIGFKEALGQADKFT